MADNSLVLIANAGGRGAAPAALALAGMADPAA
jgi:hypothetical protein